MGAEWSWPCTGRDGHERVDKYRQRTMGNHAGVVFVQTSSIMNNIGASEGSEYSPILMTAHPFIPNNSLLALQLHRSIKTFDTGVIGNYILLEYVPEGERPEDWERDLYTYLVLLYENSETPLGISLTKGIFNILCFRYFIPVRPPDDIKISHTRDLDKKKLEIMLNKRSDYQIKMLFEYKMIAVVVLEKSKIRRQFYVESYQAIALQQDNLETFLGSEVQKKKEAVLCGLGTFKGEIYLIYSGKFIR